MKNKLIIVSLFCFINSRCSEQKEPLRPHEKESSASTQLVGVRMALTPDFDDPRARVELQQKENVESVFSDPCIGEIKGMKAALRPLAYDLLRDYTLESIISCEIDPNDNLLDAQAMLIAQGVARRMSDFKNPNNETPEEYGTRFLDEELKRFIIPIPSHKNVDQARPLSSSNVKNTSIDGKKY